MYEVTRLLPSALALSRGAAQIVVSVVGWVAGGHMACPRQGRLVNRGCSPLIPLACPVVRSFVTGTGSLLIWLCRERQQLKNSTRVKKGLLHIYNNHVMALEKMQAFAQDIFSKCGDNCGLAQVESISRSSWQTFYHCSNTPEIDDDGLDDEDCNIQNNTSTYELD